MVCGQRNLSHNSFFCFVFTKLSHVYDAARRYRSIAPWLISNMKFPEWPGLDFFRN